MCLSHCEFSSWYVWFLPESSLLPGLRVGGCRRFVGEGVWCLSQSRDRVLSGALICSRPSVNEVRQIGGQLIHSGSGTPHSASLPSLGLLGLFWWWWWQGAGGGGLEIVLKKSALMLVFNLGCLCKFPLRVTAFPLRERTSCRDCKCERAKA